MEKTFEYNPQLVCSRLFKITIDGDIVKKLEVVGGCQGNLRGISKLVEGMKIDDVIASLEGIECRGSRPGIQSCLDQLANALKSIK